MKEHEIRIKIPETEETLVIWVEVGGEPEILSYSLRSGDDRQIMVVDGVEDAIRNTRPDLSDIQSVKASLSLMAKVWEGLAKLQPEEEGK